MENQRSKAQRLAHYIQQRMHLMVTGIHSRTQVMIEKIADWQRKKRWPVGHLIETANIPLIMHLFTMYFLVLNDPHPWWQVDLETVHCLGRITAILRQGCCGKDFFNVFWQNNVNSKLLNVQTMELHKFQICS